MDLGVGFTALHHRDVVVQHDGASLLDHDRRRTSHLIEPLPQERRVADGRRQCDEADGARGQDQHLFPDTTSKGILEKVDLVEHDQTERGELFRFGQQHVAQHFGRHDHDGCRAVDRRVAGEKPYA